VNYFYSTYSVLRDHARYGEGMYTSEENPETRFANLLEIVAVEAPNYVRGNETTTDGEMAQALSEWHKELETDVSATFRGLTDPEGLNMAKEAANTDEFLRTLQAIRKGVKLAMHSKYKKAHGINGRPSLNTMPTSYPVYIPK
jgi:hypothetical protein